MRRVLIVVMLVVVAAVFGLWRTGGSVRHGLSRAIGMSDDGEQGAAREEIRKSFELQPGARIEVAGINGRVDIQTSDTKTAEVYVLRTAKSRDTLSRREVTIEQTATGLMVKSRKVGHGFWDHLFGNNASEDVTIKAPRQIALALKGINGRVTTGDIDGILEAKGINGRTDLGQSAEAEINGINGNVSVLLNKIGDRGVRLNGVNGFIELRVGVGLNADLTAKGMNGNVKSELSDVTVDKEQFGSRYTARIGSGGPPITLSGVNGNVRLTRGSVTAETVTEKETSTQKKEKKSESKSEK